MIALKKMENAVNENFERYAGNVILNRAICDVRDMLKPSIRMLIYSQVNISKNTYKKPFIKSARIVGDCLGHLYEHGDSSCYGAYMRMAKPFAMRYPLEQCQGNYGTIAGEEEAAMRYTELRLNELSSYIYNGLEKNAIKKEEWRENFDETEQYPGVMPSIGFFNICNGTIGLGIAISSSIPQFNLKEINEAIISLIQNPNASDKDIIVMPDFATGGTLTNAKEVYESLRCGTGKSCCLRATMQYKPDINTIIVSEVPYGIMTGTIKKEIEAKIEEDENYGIELVNDNTGGNSPEIYIQLKQGAIANKIIKKLYKDTSLESHFTINMWVLKDGRFPQLMGLRQIFQEYITHIRICKNREIQFDLNKALARLNVVEGLIMAAASIDEVVAIIRSSQNPSEASQKLIARFGFNEEQTKAILAMKLSSLTKIDAIKLNDEREELNRKIEEYRHLLNDSTALDNELIKILQEVANKYGDARRTKIMNIVESSEEETQEIQEEELGIMLFDNNVIRLVKKEDLQGAKRGRKGVNIKPPKNANLINTLYTTNLGIVSAFTNKGRMYNFSLSDLEYGKDYSIYELIVPQDNEKVILLIDSTTFNAYKYLVTVSRNGYIKKSLIKEYGSRARKGVIAVKLEENDTLIGVYLSMNDEDRIFITSSSGNYNFYKLEELSETGRATRGVKAIKLAGEEKIQSVTLIKTDIEYKGILTITSSGRGKITAIEDFNETSRAVKGPQVMALKDENLAVIYAVPITQEHIFISANNKAVLLETVDIPVQNRVTAGIRIIDARDSNTTIEIM